MRSIVVLGGGISGLTAAYTLQQTYPDASIQLFEKEPRVGGWIQTIDNDQFLFEQGPHSLRGYGNGNAALDLIQELGLESELIGASKEAATRYLYLHGKLFRMPGCLTQAFTSPLFWKAIPGLLRELYTAPGTREESVYEFSKRRFGAHIANTFFDPLVSGIFAGDPQHLSMKACFPLMIEWEQQHGSIVRALFSKRKPAGAPHPLAKSIGRSGIFSFKHGLQQLVDALEKRLRGKIVHQEVKQLKFDRGAITVVLEDRNIAADEVVSALPAHTLGKLVGNTQLMSRLPFASVAVVNVGYRAQVLPYQGFGHLIPSHQHEQVLGVIWDSSVFKEQNRPGQTRLAVVIGGMRMRDFFDCHSQADFVQMALEGIHKQLKMTAKPDFISCRIAKNAIPQYFVGHADWVKEVEAYIKSLSPQLSLVGNSFYGISVNDCIVKARSLH